MAPEGDNTTMPALSGGRPEDVAVLVLNRNGVDFLEDCIQSVLANTAPPFDLYLIDNASEDASVGLVRSRFPMVRIIRNERNLGFAGAYDRIIRDIRHEYVLLLNNDTVVAGDWLQPLYDTIRKDERIAACGSKILSVKGSGVIDHAGGMLTLIGSGLDIGKGVKDMGKYDLLKEVGFACGCSMLIRRKAYLDVGGFDADYEFYHEDVDLCWRFWLSGYETLYVPDSVVYHYGGGGAGNRMETPWKTYLCQKNRLANMLKNMGRLDLFRGILVSLVYDGARILRFVRLGRRDLLGALFRGYLYIFRNLGKLLDKRRVIQEKRMVSDREMKNLFAPVISAGLDYRRMLKG